MSIDEFESTRDYERVSGFIYEDSLSTFVFCRCGARCRPVDGTDDYACAEDCGRTYTVQSDDGGVL